MRIVVIGGSGLVGSKVVKLLGEHGHDAVAASRETGCNVITGEGLDAAFEGADVVVDVSNSPSFADEDVMRFFATSTENQVAAEKKAGVRHHVALSIVGCDRAPDSGYLRAKVAQEALVEKSDVAYSIVRATQFFEFVGSIADLGTDGDTVRISSAPIQPMAADDVATAVARAAVGQPVGGIREVAGPDRYQLDDLVRIRLRAQDDTRRVVTDPQARYAGVVLDDRTLLPAGTATLFDTHFEDWLVDNAVAPVR